jgi:Pyruvate/2-oxoacid:ferredoxin oxidoreductase delta subunit
MGKKDHLHQIADGFGFPDSEIFLALLDILFSDEEALWVINLPASAAQLSDLLAQDELRIASGLKDLFMRGLVYITEHTDRGPRYISDNDPGRLMDMVLFDPKYKQFGKKFYDRWRNFYNQELVHIPRSPENLPFRVIPVMEKIADPRSILPYEQAIEILRSARRIAVENCPCRVRERKCNNPLETCLSFDRVADYMISRKIGREITINDALAILKECEQLGLVHTTENTDHPTVMCNCCPCCCIFLRAITVYQKENVIARSRFRAVVDQNNCSHCGTCLERCHFNAIQDHGEFMAIDPTLCFGCGLCSSTCPEDAITLIEMEGPKFIPSTDATFMNGIDGIPQEG